MPKSEIHEIYVSEISLNSRKCLFCVVPEDKETLLRIVGNSECVYNILINLKKYEELD